jgi:hypothetical protein
MFGKVSPRQNVFKSENPKQGFRASTLKIYRKAGVLGVLPTRTSTTLCLAKGEANGGEKNGVYQGSCLGYGSLFVFVLSVRK